MFERCLYFNVNALARAVNRIWDEAFAALDLSPAHAYLLRLVLQEPGLGQKAIAEELRLEKSTVTRFVDALQARGLVARAPGEDGRSQRILPTAKAKKLRQRLEQTGDELYRRMGEGLGREGLKALVTELRAAAGKLG